MNRPSISVISAMIASIVMAGRKDPVVSFRYPTAMGKRKGPILPKEDINPTELATSLATSGSSVGITKTRVTMPAVQNPAMNMVTHRGASEKNAIARMVGPLTSPKIHRKGLLRPSLSDNVPTEGPANKNPKGNMEAISPAISGEMPSSSSMSGSDTTSVS